MPETDPVTGADTQGGDVNATELAVYDIEMSADEEWFVATDSPTALDSTGDGSLADRLAAIWAEELDRAVFATTGPAALRQAS